MRYVIQKCLFITLLLGLMPGCSHLLYYPTGYKYVDENSLEYKPQEMSIPHKDQFLVAWSFEGDAKKRKPVTLAFFHGNGQNQSAHFHILYWLLAEGYNFVIFDYPGYGPSPGTPSPGSTVEAGKGFLKWLQKERPDHQIAVFGQSLGGNVALRTLSEQPPQKLCLVVIDSSFLSYKKVAQRALSRSWITWPFQWASYLLLSDRRAASSNIDQLPKTNYLVTHSEDDETVDYDLGQRLYESLPGEKTFYPYKGRHISGFVNSEDVQKRLLERLKKSCH